MPRKRISDQDTTPEMLAVLGASKAPSEKKTVDLEHAYQIYATPDGWLYFVRKHYQSPEAERTNPYARVLCTTFSPMAPTGEIGDSYLSEIRGHYSRKATLAYARQVADIMGYNLRLKEQTK